MLPYSYLLERIGQPVEMVKILPEIIALDPQRFDQHMRYIKEILLLEDDQVYLAMTELLRLEARLT